MQRKEIIEKLERMDYEVKIDEYAIVLKYEKDYNRHLFYMLSLSSDFIQCVESIDGVEMRNVGLDTNVVILMLDLKKLIMEENK